MSALGVLSMAANHMWQSTAFMVVVAFLAVVLKKNRADIRYWLWVAASMKFLIPLAVLTSVGSHFQRAASDPAMFGPSTMVAFEQFSQPFSSPELTPGASHAPTTWTVWIRSWPTFLVVMWLAGSIVIAVSSCRRWLQVRELVRRATPLSEGRTIDAMRRLQDTYGPSNPMPILASASSLEPGLFGVFHPILLFPADIEKRLNDFQLEAIIAHELSHARRRDNLWAMIHMVVEAAFWFHPLVWLLGARLVDERERACDEDVMRGGCQPEVYARAMVQVCESCLASPVKCVSGIGGSGLKKRIEVIMINRTALQLNLARKALLTIVGLASLSAAVLVASLRTPTVFGSVQSALSGHAPTAAGASELLHFEVASIKPNQIPNAGVRGGCRGGDSKPGPDGLFGGIAVPVGRCVITGARLSHLINIAYDLKLVARARGVPDWDGPSRFDVEAKAEDPATATEQQLLQMLQSLLAEQFKLALHFDTEQIDGYVLVVDRNGPKLRPSTTEGVEAYSGHAGVASELNGQRVSMTSFATKITNQSGLSAPIIDKTGLTGAYDLKLTWQPPDRPGAPIAEATGSSIFTALQEQLGLRLVPQKVPFEYLIVDHAEKPAGSTASLLERPTVAPTQAVDPSRFEVASIKPNHSGVTPSAMGVGPVGPTSGPMGCHGTDRGPQAIPLGRCVFRNVTAGFLISVISVLDETEYKLGEVPDWVTSEGFDIEAKAEHPVSQKELGLMLTTLLLDRFKCTFHRETREVSGFALIASPKGAKLQTASSQEPQTRSEENTSIRILDESTKRPVSLSTFPPGRTVLLVSPKANMATLANVIERYWTGPVVDRTELPGFYNLELRWLPDENLATETTVRTGPALPTALEEQLGLKLQSGKVPVEFLLVDHIEKPTFN